MASRVSENFLQSDPWELAQIAEPEFLQRGPVTELSDGRRIRTVIPPSERRTMTREDEMAQREQALDLISKETQVEHGRLQQQAALRDEQRKLNTIKQSEQFMSELDELIPGNEDYEANLAAKIRKNPLSVDHSAVKSQIELLNKQHEKLKGTDEVLQRSRILAQEADERQNLDQARTALRPFGPEVMAEFEQEILDNEAARAKDPSVPKINPSAAAFRRADKKADEELKAQLYGVGIDPDQFMIQNMGPGGIPLSEPRLNKRAAEAAIKRLPTAANIDRAQKDLTTLEEAKKERTAPDSDDPWTDEDDLRLRVLRKRFSDYAKAQGLDKDEDATKREDGPGGTAAPAKKKTAADYF